VNTADLSPERVIELAASSGKPLEVACAAAFLADDWQVRLGSHYADGALDVIRELDVLAERELPLSRPGTHLDGVTCRLRALVSCRGFPADRFPLAYSVSRDRRRPITFEPSLLCTRRTPGTPTEVSYGHLPWLETAGAAELLALTRLEDAGPLVAFDTLEWNEPPKKPPNELTRGKDGDRQVFTAIDSAVRAAFYWCEQDILTPASDPAHHFVALNVPVCVLSLPFWDVCIDHGIAGQTQLRHSGYQSNLYPTGINRLQLAMALVWSKDELGSLVTALRRLFHWFYSQTSYGLQR
jgi:hypothetical protein